MTGSSINRLRRTTSAATTETGTGARRLHRKIHHIAVAGCTCWKPASLVLSGKYCDHCGTVDTAATSINGIDDRWHKRVKGRINQVNRVVCWSAAGSRWRVRWVDGGRRGAQQELQRKTPTRRYLTHAELLMPASRAGSKRSPWCSATAAYGPVSCVPCGRKRGDRVRRPSDRPLRLRPATGIAESTTKTKRDRHVPVPESLFMQAPPSCPPTRTALRPM